MVVYGFMSTLMVMVACFSCSVQEAYGRSFAEKFLGSAEKAISTIKSNPKYVQKIDELVEHVTTAGQEMVDTVNMLVSDDEKELLKQELKESARIIEATIKEEAKTVDQNVRQILGNDKMACFENEVNATTTALVEKIDTPENKELLSQLGNDLKPVASELEALTVE